MNSAIDGGCLTHRYRHLVGGSPDVAGTVAHRQGYQIDASILGPVALRPQLHRLTVGGNDNVIDSVTVTRIERVLDLIARRFLDDHAVDEIAAASFRRALHHLGDGECAI